MHNYPLIEQQKIDLFQALDLPKPLIIAGPCAVESEKDMIDYAKFLSDQGIKYLRCGIYKPRTSPHDFQGLRENGLSIIQKIKEMFDLKIVTEITAIDQIEKLLPLVDIFQIGARNMQNFELIKAVAKTNKPILLKRGFGNTIDEWLGSLEYILECGNPYVILCERGIRTFEPMLRNTLDLAGALMVKKLTNQPVIVDPSHATGNSELVTPLAKASIVAGCDGFMVEIHRDPKNALSDPEQALTLQEFKSLIASL